jgi:hypothetical protein
MEAPLETRELATLLVRLEQGVRETSGRFKVQMTLVTALFVAMGIGMAVVESWGVAAFVWAFAAGLAFIGVRASKRTAPAQMQPIFDAVREAPEQIVLVRHYQTSDSARMFVTDWIEIRTATHRLLMKAPDWEQLFGYLRRRCPAAETKPS